jgi:hypothetical protein
MNTSVTLAPIMMSLQVESLEVHIQTDLAAAAAAGLWTGQLARRLRRGGRARSSGKGAGGACYARCRRWRGGAGRFAGRSPGRRAARALRPPFPPRRAPEAAATARGLGRRAARAPPARRVARLWAPVRRRARPKLKFSETKFPKNGFGPFRSSLKPEITLGF